MSKRMTDLEAFLVRHKLHPTMRAIILADSNLNSRSRRLRKKILSYRRQEKKFVKKYKANIHQKDVGSLVSPEVRELQYMHLEIIQDMQILSETFLRYFQGFRERFDDFPTYLNETQRERFYMDEINFIKSIKIKDIAEVLHFPDISTYPISGTSKKHLRKEISIAGRNFRTALQNVCRFRERYKEVYNKHKHTLSEIVGLSGRSNGYLSAPYYFTGQGYTQRGKKRVKTYIVDVGPEAVDYLHSIGSDLISSFRMLLISQWLYIRHRKKPTYPMLMERFNPQLDVKRHKNILSEIPNLHHSHIPQLFFDVNWTARTHNTFRRKLSKYYVTYVLKDLFKKVDFAKYFEK